MKSKIDKWFDARLESGGPTDFLLTLGATLGLAFVFMILPVVVLIGLLFPNCNEACMMAKMLVAYEDCVTMGISEESCASMVSSSYAQEAPIMFMSGAGIR